MTQYSKFVAATGAVLAATGAGPPIAASPAPPPNGGTIAIEPGIPTGEPDRAAPAFVDAVSSALAAKGFTILNDPGHSAYVAEVSFSRTEVGTGSARVTRERGTVTPGGAGGMGGAITVPLSGPRSRSVPLARIQLDVRIHKRGEQAVVWRGAAVTVRVTDTRQGANRAIAASLSEAILRGYPLQPQGMVGIP